MSRDQFVELVNRARGEKAPLRNPDLKLALAWRDESKPSSAWAKRYSRADDDCETAMRYLEVSETSAREEVRTVVEQKVRSGASWFYWLAIASAINSVVQLTGGGWGFVFSLGLTQLVDDAMSSAGVAAVGIVFNLLVIGVFLLFGKFAHKGRRWAFIVGMSLYALDGLITLVALEKPFFPVLFHVWVLYGLYSGLRVCTALHHAGMYGVLERRSGARV